MSDSPEQKTEVAEPVQLAVFDFDGTIMSGQSGSLFSMWLLRRGLISKRTAARLVWWGGRYKLHLPFRQDESRELIFRDIGKLGYDRTIELMGEFVDEVLVPRERPAAVAEVARRSAEGKKCVLVSATFYEMARLAAERLGMDAVAATHMQRDERGNLTGRVDGEVVAGEGKVRAVTALANARYGEGAWQVACAYGDHFTDAPLLSLAAEPFVVNPGPTLKRIAARNGWQSLDWK